ncbi:MAG: hypothetical protein DHS20C13_22880 [Thermodesulfobacteriota bacterium]|nr:MAG: hypothetical protein DHS20C13_22880 [Thermodesulfobacteriota bacterium]
MVAKKKESQSVAIVGVSCRLPGGCDTPDKFWRLLIEKENPVSKLPRDRWEWPRNIDLNRRHRGIDKAAFLEDISLFDADFFNIAPREAKLIDPQQRILLEMGWTCLEDAGYAPPDLFGKNIGVFIGVSDTGYHSLLSRSTHEVVGPYLSTGVGSFSISNRLSYFFNFSGPSLSIDTASSSSLVAFCQAVDAVSTEQCEAALVGGVNLICTPDTSISYYLAGMLSEDALCKSFGAGANGYVRGEGGCLFLLKKLSQAEIDGDHIYGVIRGGAFQHAGNTSSFTVPSVDSQAQLLEKIYGNMELDLSTITYIEAHGSGTSIGDPIEISALQEACKRLERYRTLKDWRCAVGSVKSNIGHLESASGMAGILKVLLAFKNKQLPSTLHHSMLNEKIHLDGSPFYILNKNEIWTPSHNSIGKRLPLRAGVSSFGLGGVIAHIVLEESLSNDTKRKWKNIFLKGGGLKRKIRSLESYDDKDGLELFIFSAKNKKSLRGYVNKFLEFILSDQKVRLVDIAYTLQVARAPMAERLAIVTSNIEELGAHLQAYLHGECTSDVSFSGNAGKNTPDEFVEIHSKKEALKNRNLVQLACWWVAGETFDWSDLYVALKPKKVSVPTYVFSKESYWLNGVSSTDRETKKSGTSMVQNDVMKMVAGILEINHEKIDLDIEIIDLSLDSLACRDLAVQLSNSFEIDLDPTIFYEVQTLEELCKLIEKKLEKDIPDSVEKVEQSETSTDAAGDKDTALDIAVIGMAAELPCSKNIDMFWDNLISGSEMISEIPRARWGYESFIDAEYPQIKMGGFIADVEKFDANFFRISPLEAESMDPQQRRFIQIIWQTLADARIHPDEVSGKHIGLFVGVMGDDYAELLTKNNVKLTPYTPIGLSRSMLANRISFLLNIRGPSEAIDTACSSSLVAIHRAILALLNGECEMAFAGGVNLILSPNTSIAFSQAGMLSPDGQCQTFDKRANGYVRSEGVASLLLKPLKKAIADGDTIHGVIKSSAVNHGGRATSLTAPNANAQSDLILKAYVQAGIDPKHITYIETHGTGTSLGDPVEINALKKAFSALYMKWGYDTATLSHCGLGSLKSNMGHAEAAAGVAGVIKVLLSMKNKQLPGMLHHHELNPLIKLKKTPFYLVKEKKFWETATDDSLKGKIPRYAGVSSFGFGGVSAHLVLAEHCSELTNNREFVPRYEFKGDKYWFSPGIKKEFDCDKTADEDVTRTIALKPKLIPINQQIKSDEKSVKHYVLLIEANCFLPISDTAHVKEPEFIRLSSNEIAIEDKFRHYSWAILFFIQNLIKQKISGDILLQVVIPLSEQFYPGHGLAGMLRTAYIEYPQIRTQLVMLNPIMEKVSTLIQLIKEASVLPYSELQHSQSIWSHYSWQEIQDLPLVTPWKHSGVYLISGGMGGLGRILLEDIIRKEPTAKIVLIGRSSANNNIQEIRERSLKNVRYYSLDVTNVKEVNALIEEIMSMYGRLDGIIHAAGVTQDSYIIQKTEQELNAVLKPKVDGMVVLDQATKHIVLDFFVAFSSFVSNVGNSGQADYAAANGFLNEFMKYRADLVNNKTRHGRSLSISWPFWTDGGMKMPGEVAEYFKDSAGIFPLTVESGLKLFYQAIVANESHVLMLFGNMHCIREWIFGDNENENLNEISDDSSQKDLLGLEKEVLFELRKIFSHIIKAPVEVIEEGKLFSDYGVDSIMIIQINKKLSVILGEISKTVFYECRTLGEVAQYFVTRYKKKCCEWIGREKYNSLEKSETISEILKNKNSVLSKEATEEIAIIGVAGCYPGSKDIHQFWRNLRDAKESIMEVPEERWNWQDYFVPYENFLIDQGKSYSRWGGFIDGFDEFDYAFFRISPREAMNMDPQERLFLQNSWHTFEDAGYTRDKLDKFKVGVFVGVTKTGFELHHSGEELKNGFSPRTSFSSIANRISYFYSLNGPSLAIDTMCSSSLVAINSACERLINCDCDLALAGGVNLYLHPENYVYLSQMKMLSRDNNNCSFGEGASGFIPGEGVGSVLLKRLIDAERDGDTIYATVLSSAVNHGGHTSGYTVPNPKAQSDVISLAIEKSGLNVEDINYIEGHGTGTILGDPIEITGLTRAFENSTNKKQYCAIGSVKSNIGHLEAAAGIAGVTKVLLQFKHKQKVSSLHAAKLNPNINISNTPFFVQRDLTSWVPITPNAPRAAGISSFGAGGVNAHLILREYQKKQKTIKTNSDNCLSLIILSAADDDGLLLYARKLTDFLESSLKEEIDVVSLVDLAFTLGIGREAMTYRLAFIVPTLETLVSELNKFLTNSEACDPNTVLYGVSEKESLSKEKCSNEDLDLYSIAEKWVKGFSVSLKDIYRKEDANFISLPTYVFKKNKIWFPLHKRKKEKTLEDLPITPVNQQLETEGLIKLQTCIRPIKHNNAAKGENMEPTKPLISLRELPTMSSMKEGPTLNVEIEMHDIKLVLIAQLAELLFLEINEITQKTSFIDLGLDSIIGVEWVRKIGQHFGIKIAASKIYDYPNIAEFSLYLTTQLKSSAGAPVKEEDITDHSNRDEVSLHSAEKPSKIVKDRDLQQRHSSAFEANLQPEIKDEASVNDYCYSEAEKKESEEIRRPLKKIAIVGMAGRFPGAKNTDEFWENISNGIDSVRVIPNERWRDNGEFDLQKRSRGKIYTNKLGMLDDVDEFDPLFFGLSPTDAECMDPQQRIFLEEAWAAFEDAGYSPKQLNGTQCGTYVGVMQTDYAYKLHEHSEYKGLAQTAMGTSSAIFAARIAYNLNLTGPAVSIDTACSSSLVATHLACQALSNDEIDMALVGGGTLYLNKESYLRMCDAGMLSQQGYCAVFDDKADGFVPGEAVNAVVLKRLEDAERDSDHIYGVILASGINQDGKTNGITAPSTNSQIALQKSLYQRFDIDPSSISYIEAHGTGTKLGDPIEMDALMNVFNACPEHSCAIGSVKSNVGHTSAAAGLVSLQKVLLLMEHQQLVPSLHFEKANEHINFDRSPFYVNTELKEWKSNSNKPRRAAINSFGFSGTNAHLVIEEYQVSRNVSEKLADFSGEPVMIPVSAKKIESLRALVIQLQTYILQRDVNLIDLSFTLQVGREAMSHRVVFLARTVEELREQFLTYMGGGGNDNIFTGKIGRENNDVDIFCHDEDIMQGIRHWIEKRKLKQLAKMWVNGGEIEWMLFPQNIAARRISLPTYVFSREKYWLSATLNTNEVHSVKKTEKFELIPEINKKLDDLIFLKQSLVRKNLGESTATISRKTVLFIDCPKEMLKFDSEDCDIERIYSSVDAEASERTLDIFSKTFSLIKNHLNNLAGKTDRFVIVVPFVPENFLYQPIVGLLRTAFLENKKFQGKLLELNFENFIEPHKLFRCIMGELNSVENDRYIRYLSDYERYVSVLKEIEKRPEILAPPIKSGGVYWITGGLGGLGKIFSGYLVECGAGVLVLSGRSTLTVENKKYIERLSSQGVHVEYRQSDLSKKENVKNIVEEIKQKFGKLNGILHASGSIQDSFIQKKELYSVEQVWRSKVQVIEYIDKVTKELALDFIVLFSSISAVLGNIGQADYSGANIFLDAFSSYRNKLVEAGMRQGRTVSINWPLWRNGGMKITQQKEEWFERLTGIVSLETEQGISAFDFSLNQEDDHIVVLSGQHEKIREYCNIFSEEEATESMPTNDKLELAYQDLKNILSEVLKIEASALALDEPLSEYGVDSIYMMSLLNKLEVKYDCVIEPSVFVNYPTIHLLASYLIDEDIFKSQKTQRLARNSKVDVRMEGSVSQLNKPRKKVAIIAQACRFPQSESVEKFWENLSMGNDLIREVPPGRWDQNIFHGGNSPMLRKKYTNLGGFLSDISMFDANYFKVPEEEAATIDPQQRIMLELSEELFKAAGYNRDYLDGRDVGIFLGAKENNYIRNYLHVIPENQLKHMLVNSIGNMMAARISNFYNLTGPSKVIDTACSSSLVAIHDACQYILDGKSEMALSGGIYLLMDSFAHIGFTEAGVLSDDGKAYVFDERAKGIVLGEGAGLILLKDYDAAIRDGDQVLGIISGSAVNNDGYTVGLTVPSQEGQKRVIAEALKNSQVDPADITYFEAHGTGTLLGDPIEIRAATQVFQEYTNKQSYCALGSVKSNMGHLMMAAGIASVIKVLLSLKHKKIPATLHCDRPHPRFKFSESPFYPNLSLTDWRCVNGPRIASVSSFGFGGTNCHMIIEEA